MTWENIEMWIWRRWKAHNSLPRMVKELSSRTMWSGYYSLCFIVNYLHNKKGVGFSRRQLKYAFRQVLEDVEGDPPSKKGAWIWLLKLGGYGYGRGKASKLRLRVGRRGAILSSLRPKIADEGISPGEEYNYTPPGEKSPQIEYFAPERGTSSEKGDSLQEVEV